MQLKTFLQHVVLLASLAVSGPLLAQTSIPPATAPASGDSHAVAPFVSPGPVASGGEPVRLGAGDLIEVSVYNVPELDTKIRVSNSGEINLPLIEDVHVAGLSVQESEAVIERRLEQGGFVKQPHVQVSILEYTSQGASVLGEVSRPGIYPVLGDEKLFNLISAAGGLTDRAGRSITLTHRDQPPVTVAISHNLDDHPESDVAVLPGDIVTVRRADVVYVVGDVGRPSGIIMDSGHISVLQAIALAGGTNPTAKLNGARVVRKGPAGLTVVPVPLKQLLEAKSEDMPMQADDILFVPTSSRKLMQARTAEAAVQMATAAGIVMVRP
jgi:polysaccharide export outer membrane protein